MGEPGPVAPRRSRRDWPVGLALSLIGHLAILAGFLWTIPPAAAPPGPDQGAVTVELVDARSLSSPGPVRAPDARPSPAAARAKAPATSPAAAAAYAPWTGGQTGMGASGGDGRADGDGDGGAGGGGSCDMARRIEAALSRDALTRAALAGARGSPTVVWDGDWVKSAGEDGKGLAAVREAVIWEIAFAPRECRAQSVRGGLVLTVPGAAGPVRLLVGAANWRWSDLLAAGPPAR